MSKIILVTGGAGYIGSHAVVELINAGFSPVILDNFNNSNKNVIDAIEAITSVRPDVIEGDCRDSAIFDYIFETYPIEAVIHFAADKAVGESVQNPLKYFDNNLIGLIRLLQGMNKHGVKNLVFSSSCTVYGAPKLPYVTEETPMRDPESPYGFTKFGGEKILQNMVKHQAKMNVVLLRYFNPIGAHPSTLIGEQPQGIPNNLLPYITQTAAGKRSCLSVFGSDYPTTDGTCVRDYIHVCDVAAAHVKAIDLIKSKTESFIEAINIGTGKGTSVLEIIRIFEEVTGRALNWQYAPRRAGDVPEIYAKVDKASTLLNWETRYSVHDAVQHAWNWEKRMHEL